MQALAFVSLAPLTRSLRGRSLPALSLSPGSTRTPCCGPHCRMGGLERPLGMYQEASCGCSQKSGLRCLSEVPATTSTYHSGSTPGLGDLCVLGLTPPWEQASTSSSRVESRLPTALLLVPVIFYPSRGACLLGVGPQDWAPACGSHCSLLRASVYPCRLAFPPGPLPGAQILPWSLSSLPTRLHVYLSYSFGCTANCGKLLKRWKYQTTLPASWEICMQVKKQQLELDMEQQTGSKEGNE